MSGMFESLATWKGLFMGAPTIDRWLGFQKFAFLSRLSTFKDLLMKA